MPKTLLGKWSVGLIIAFFLLFAVGSNIAKTYGGADQTFFSNPIIFLPMLSAGASAIASFFTGIIGIWKQKERSVFVLLATAIGLFVLIFVIGYVRIQQLKKEYNLSIRLKLKDMDIERRGGNGTPKEIERVEISIALSELVHGIPVDKDHVQTLARSIGQSGQLSPLLVWTRDNQIIDGFHRLEALRQLGANTAVCNLIECNEEEFRDARITSAVTHKGVSFARVVTWTREVFSYTPWASKIRSAEAFHLERAVQYPKGYRRALRFGLATEELGELLGWVRHKSAIWGLKSEQIANMLDLADITAPMLIPLVRERHKPREEVLTRPMLRRIVSQVPDHQAQEALVKKATVERLNEAEVKRLVMSYANAETQEQRGDILSTSWLDVTKPTPTPFLKGEEARKAEEESRRLAERNRIDMTRSIILEITGTLPNLPIDNHPDLKSALDEAINQLLIGVAQYQGERVDIVERLQNQIEQLSKENLSLRDENALLNRNLTSLRNTLGIARRISDEEHRIRRDT